MTTLEVLLEYTGNKELGSRHKSTNEVMGGLHIAQAKRFNGLVALVAVKFIDDLGRYEVVCDPECNKGAIEEIEWLYAAGAQTAPMTEDVNTTIQTVPMTKEVEVAVETTPMTKEVEVAVETTPMTKEVEVAVETTPMTEEVEVAVETTPMTKEVEVAKPKTQPKKPTKK